MRRCARLGLSFRRPLADNVAMKNLSLQIVALCLTASALAGELTDWPRWRGPHDDGCAAAGAWTTRLWAWTARPDHAHVAINHDRSGGGRADGAGGRGRSRARASMTNMYLYDTIIRAVQGALGEH